jgi:hypothetical protein
MLDGISIEAACSPSLKAECTVGRIRSHGMTGNIIFCIQLLKIYDTFEDRVIC